MTGYVKWRQAVTAEVTLSGLQQQVTFITSHFPEVGSTRAAEMGDSKAWGLPRGFEQGLGWSCKHLRPGCSLPWSHGWQMCVSRWLEGLSPQVAWCPKEKAVHLGADSPGQEIRSGLLCPSLELRLHSATFHLLESQ